MININVFCRLFYSSHYVPIAAYDGGEQSVCCCSLEQALPIFSAAKDALLHAEQNPAVYAAPAGLYGAVAVKGTQTQILVGPVFGSGVSEETVYAFMHMNAISVENKSDVASFLSALPKYTYNQFLNLLAYLHFVLNGQTIDLIEHFRLSDAATEQRIAAAHTMRSAYAKETKSEHGTYQFEMRMLDCVRRGDGNGLNALFDAVLKTQAMTEGILAENPLRQAKNLLIGLVTMVGKVGGIGGGLDVEETYRLIDLYVQECEKTQSIERVKMLQYNLVTDFTERVAKCRLPAGVSREVFACIQFIKNHTNDRIGLDDVAAHIKKSRAYTTRRFKAETGKTIGAFITECKIDEACSLLRHSDASILDISNYLYFSNSSYFQNMFKRIVGTTPAAYRSGAGIQMER